MGAGCSHIDGAPSCVKGGASTTLPAAVPAATAAVRPRNMRRARQYELFIQPDAYGSVDVSSATEREEALEWFLNPPQFLSAESNNSESVDPTVSSNVNSWRTEQGTSSGNSFGFHTATLPSHCVPRAPAPLTHPSGSDGDNRMGYNLFYRTIAAASNRSIRSNRTSGSDGIAAPCQFDLVLVPVSSNESLSPWETAGSSHQHQQRQPSSLLSSMIINNVYVVNRLTDVPMESIHANEKIVTPEKAVVPNPNGDSMASLSSAGVRPPSSTADTRPPSPALPSTSVPSPALSVRPSSEALSHSPILHPSASHSGISASTTSSDHALALPVATKKSSTVDVEDDNSDAPVPVTIVGSGSATLQPLSRSAPVARVWHSAVSIERPPDQHSLTPATDAGTPGTPRRSVLSLLQSSSDDMAEVLENQQGPSAAAVPPAARPLHSRRGSDTRSPTPIMFERPPSLGVGEGGERLADGQVKDNESEDDMDDFGFVYDELVIDEIFVSRMDTSLPSFHGTPAHSDEETAPAPHGTGSTGKTEEEAEVVVRRSVPAPPPLLMPKRATTVRPAPPAEAANQWISKTAAAIGRTTASQRSTPDTSSVGLALDESQRGHSPHRPGSSLRDASVTMISIPTELKLSGVNMGSIGVVRSLDGLAAMGPIRSHTPGIAVGQLNGGSGDIIQYSLNSFLSELGFMQSSIIIQPTETATTTATASSNNCATDHEPEGEEDREQEESNHSSMNSSILLAMDLSSLQTPNATEAYEEHIYPLRAPPPPLMQSCDDSDSDSDNEGIDLNELMATFISMQSDDDSPVKEDRTDSSVVQTSISGVDLDSSSTPLRRVSTSCPGDLQHPSATDALLVVASSSDSESRGGSLHTVDGPESLEAPPPPYRPVTRTPPTSIDSENLVISCPRAHFGKMDKSSAAGRTSDAGGDTPPPAAPRSYKPVKRHNRPSVAADEVILPTSNPDHALQSPSQDRRDTLADVHQSVKRLGRVTVKRNAPLNPAAPVTAKVGKPSPKPIPAIRRISVSRNDMDNTEVNGRCANGNAAYQRKVTPLPPISITAGDNINDRSVNNGTNAAAHGRKASGPHAASHDIITAGNTVPPSSSGAAPDKDGKPSELRHSRPSSPILPAVGTTDAPGRTRRLTAFAQYVTTARTPPAQRK